MDKLENRLPRVEEPFWKVKPLDAMTAQEWESLCDGCGRCCLVKLEDEDTGIVHHTDVSCPMLDGDTCRCKDYENRRTHVPDCVQLEVEVVKTVDWLPPTCAYKIVADGGDLPWWHPLVSGDPETVHLAGVSVRGRVYCTEDEMPLEDIIDRVCDWPNERP